MNASPVDGPFNGVVELDEPVLPDDYRIYGDYLYVVDVSFSSGRFSAMRMPGAFTKPAALD
jgi:hypothetical protein